MSAQPFRALHRPLCPFVTCPGLDPRVIPSSMVSKSRVSSPLFCRFDMSEGKQGPDLGNGAGSLTGARMRHEATTQRDEEAAAQAVRICQDAEMMMYLEALGSDVVQFALDVGFLKIYPVY